MDGLLILGLAVVGASGLSLLSGPLYHLLEPELTRPLGLANAGAAGLMMGAALALALYGWGEGPGLGFGLGALVGIIPGIAAFKIQDSSSSWGGSEDSGPPGPPGDPRAPFLRHALHSAPEGVAIGVAGAMNLGLGLVLAAALALHNVAEGLSLVRATHQNGGSDARGALLAVLSNLPQVALAVAAFGLVAAVPDLAAAGVGFSVAALVYLTLVDLLPEAYRRTGEMSIGIVVAVAMSTVPLLAGALGL